MHAETNLSAPDQRTAIVVLNWSRATTTITCLESLLGLKNADYRIFVCDNGSGDDSVARILAWAEAASLTVARRRPGDDPDETAHRDPLVTVIEIGENRGFAGGVNAGLRHAMRQGGFSHYWILNNDTRVDPNALAALNARMAADNSIGLCGSTLLEGDPPHALQAPGGVAFDFDRVTGGPMNAVPEGADVVAAVEAQIGYIIGASMFASHTLLIEIGLMPEDYFLYFEEVDWALRIRCRFRLGWARDSIVYHHMGTTTGLYRALPSLVGIWFRSRNKMLFARRHAPQASWATRRRELKYAIYWLVRRWQLRRAWLVLSAVVWDLLGRTPSMARDARWVSRVTKES